MEHRERSYEIIEEMTELLSVPEVNWQRVYELSEELREIADAQR